MEPAAAGGTLQDGLRAFQVAEKISADSGGRVATITQTAVSDLLGDPRFLDALKTASGGTEAADAILKGTLDATGKRIDGLWDIASRNLASAASGDVRTITPFAEAGSTFAQTELPALLENPNVKTIDGIYRELLIAIRDDVVAKGGSSLQAIEAVKSTVATSSWLSSLELEVSRSATGVVEAVGTGKFFTDNPGVTDLTLPPGAANKTGISHLMESMPESSWNLLRNGEATLRAGEKLLGAVETGSHYLSKGGAIGAAVSLILATKDANAAYAAGDSAHAQSIMVDWGAKFAAGFAAGAASAAVVGKLLSPLVGTGPWGAAAWTVATGVAGIVGGIGGDEAMSHLLGIFHDPSTTSTIQGNWKITRFTNGVEYKELVQQRWPRSLGQNLLVS